MATIGLLGGTFDPVHHGHLRSALECQESLHLDHVLFIPCQQPLLKAKAVAHAQHRVNMLQLAIAKQSNWSIDTRELTRKTPSYMIDTLISLRQEMNQASLCLLLGSDAFAELPRWHRWEELLSFCHLVIIERPGTSNYPDKVLQLLLQSSVTTQKPLHSKSAGCIFIQKTTALDISSTEIRSLITQNKNPRYLLPDAVCEYLDAHNIY